MCMPETLPTKAEPLAPKRTGLIKRFFAAIAEIRRGIALPLAALAVLKRNRRLMRVAALPLLINTLVYVLAIAGGFHLIHIWQPSIGEWAFWGPVGGWLSSFINWTIPALKWGVGIVIFLASYFSFRAVGMIVASPFNDLLSEAVEGYLCEARSGTPPTMKQSVHTAIFSLADTMWNVTKQLFCMLLVLPLLLIPVLGWIPLFVITAYFTGLGFFEVATARNLMRNAHKHPAVRAMRWRIFGLGIIMECMFLVPFGGLIVLPLGVIAGTLMYCDNDWDEILAKVSAPLPPRYEAPRLKREPTTIEPVAISEVSQ
ncbi:MAG: CysZ protein [Rhodothermales bacterium]|jgi:CysZ protein